jgi:acyl-CoA thioester hydrolase
MHEVTFRVYYEDTDSGGVVYYANYLKFAERARTELLRSLSINQSELVKTDAILFVVRHVEMDLLKGARLDDLLQVKTHIDKLSGASLTMNQSIFRENEALCNIKVKIACVNSDIIPTRIPKLISQKFKKI